MQQLIDELSQQYNISKNEVTGIIYDLVNYAEQKSPGLKNSLYNVFSVVAEEREENTNNQAEATVQTVATTNAPVGKQDETMFDIATHYVEDHVPGGMKEKAAEVMGEMGNKLKGLFN